MPAGRPTLYTPELVEKAREYLENYNTKHGHAIPSVVGFAKVLGYHKDTLYEWAKHDDKKDFSDTLRQINNNQEFELVDGGLTNKFNSNITKLALANHGYSDKQETALSGTVETKSTLIYKPVGNDRN